MARWLLRQQDVSQTSRIIAGTRTYGLIVAGWALWWLGYPDQAAQRAEAALTYAQKLAHPVTLTWVLCQGAIIAQFRRAVPATYERAEAAIALGTARGFQHVVAWSTVLRGWALAMQGQGEAGITQMRQGLTDWQCTGAEMDRPHLLALLAEGYATIGQTEHGLAILTEALAAVEAYEQRFYEAELYRLKGVLLLAQSANQHAEAADCLHQALVIARRQQARSLELRAAMSLSRLWQQHGKRAEARQLLGDVHGWFTEGFETADLQDAKAVLAELA
jgi:predicted ATPase